MIGHCLGAAGGLEAIATVKAITTGWVHPSINQFVSVGLPRHSEFSRQTSRIRQVNNH
jgi:3-oxoacyl-(acyl-carrier-protein) synthase